MSSRTCAIALAATLILAAAPAQAATITVNTAADNTPTLTECQGAALDCSLRQAIDKAVSGVDNISIPGTVTAITVQPGHGPLAVDKDLTIVGQGAGVNTIDGANNDGIFEITGESAVTISNVTLQHGRKRFGAAVESDGGHLTLSGVNVKENTSAGSNVSGFGVVTMTASNPSTLTIADSSFSTNIVGGGGTNGDAFGVVDVSPTGQNATVSITNTAFTNNTLGGGGGTGFGVLNVTPTPSPSAAVAIVDLESVTFAGNHLGNGGGSAFGSVDFGSGVGAEHLTVRKSTFDGNVLGGGANGTGNSGLAEGGGIYAAPGGGTVTVEDSIFTNNTVGGPGAGGSGSGFGEGGGIMTSFSGAGTLTISGSTFTGNKAGGAGAGGSASGTGAGAAIAATWLDDSPSTISITGNRFEDNTAGGPGGLATNSGRALGGALFAELSSGVNSTIAGNTFTGTTAGGDGGTGINSGLARGAAVFFTGGASTTFVNNTVTGNSGGGSPGAGVEAGAGNGALDLLEGTYLLLNDTIDGNTAGGAADPSGGIFGQGAEGSDITLKNTIVAGNTVNGTKANCNEPFASAGGNVEDSSPSQCGLGGADHVGVNPLLASLASLGGPTPTQRLLAGSPAIDGGTNAGCPASDQRGVLRSAGICDVGAFEVATPAATSGVATGVTASSATLTGSAVNPALVAGSTVFQFGKTTAYGSQTAVQALPAQSSGPRSAVLTGLEPGTLYHYRLVVSNAEGQAAGADQTFTTGNAGGRPRLSTLAVRPSTIRPAKGRGPSISARKRGATISYTDSRAAITTLTVRIARKGFRSGKRCAAKRPKRGKARRCTFYEKVGSFKRADAAGKNSFHFTGRVKRRPLKPGRYRLEAVASQGGLRSTRLRAGFRVVR
jgi:hypothetical protein